MTSATPPDEPAGQDAPDDERTTGLEHLGPGRYPEPLATDGVGVVTVGTVLWGVALLALLPFWDRLDAADRLWWVPACGTGLVLGLIGLYYCLRRRDALRREGETALAAALRGDPRVESPLPTAVRPVPVRREDLRRRPPQTGGGASRGRPDTGRPPRG